MIRNFVTFLSDLPDDSTESGGDIVIPAGKNVMEQTRNAFRSLGYETTGVDQHSHYGWFFEAFSPTGEYWLMLQYPSPWLLMIRDSRSIFSRLVRGKREFIDFLATAEMAMKQMNSVSNVRWHSESEWREEITTNHK